MKNIYIFKTIFLVILGLFMIVSCNEDFLELKPLTEFSEVDVFGDPVLIETYVNGIYRSVRNPISGPDGVLKGEFVDEAHDMWYNFFEFNNCLFTSDDLQNWFFESWNPIYSNIRNCNVFFENVDQGEFNDAVVDGVKFKDRLTGEVHFIRALLYHQLVSLYGGVPLIKSTYGLTDDFGIVRSSYAECVEFIIEECDLAASMLPLVNTGINNGRATKGAALALKSEVLLYAASDLHNNNQLFSGFESPELLVPYLLF